MKSKFIREDVDFYSNKIKCSAWLYLPMTKKKVPVIVMANGLGGTRDIILYKYAEKFVNEGYACLLFDYRNYGDSDGNKRQLVNVKMQLQDWNSAIDFIKKDNRIDSNNILLFGTSFSGGHVIYVSAHRKDIKGTVAQCPYVNTFATIKETSWLYLLKKVPYVIADLFSCLIGYHPVMLKLITYTDENAFMKTSKKMCKKIVGDSNFINAVPARTLLQFLKYSPGKYLEKIHKPIYVSICSNDTLAPAKKTLELVKDLKHSIYKKYDCEHFEICFDEYFDEAIVDYIEFYNNVCK